MRTKGNWEVSKLASPAYAPQYGIFAENSPHCHAIVTHEAEENAAFIALAGTVAHKLDSMGYDGEKAIELLPEIMAALNLADEDLNWGTDGGLAVTSVLNKLKP